MKIDQTSCARARPSFSLDEKGIRFDLSAGLLVEVPFVVELVVVE